MKKVLLIIGTRPEAVKMAPVWQAFAKMPEIKARICVTAQHRQMLDQVLAVFRITPDYDLNIMKRSQTLADITAEALRGVETVIDDALPDLVLVHGDTSTAFAAALAAFYRHVPIGHVEAGLRTNDKYSPFPEEMNRQLVDRLSDLFFAPTAVSRDNLLAENVPPEKIYVTGNTVIDARKDYSHPELEHIGPGERIILLTAHRRENLGEPLRRIFRAVRRLTEDMSELRVIYPVHLNPLVRSAADEILAGCGRVKMIEPLSVLDFHNFMARADLILTDSGGVQEEAPSLGKPVLVLRGTTERPEGISAGTLKLVGTDEERIYRETLRLLTDPDAYAAMSRAVNPYGDGHASERIAQIVASL